MSERVDTRPRAFLQQNTTQAEEEIRDKKALSLTNGGHNSFGQAAYSINNVLTEKLQVITSGFGVSIFPSLTTMLSSLCS